MQEQPNLEFKKRKKGKKKLKRNIFIILLYDISLTCLMYN